jgi:hypothetical protein
MSSRTLRSLLFIACALTVRPALAETPAAILAGLEQEAKSTPNHQGFSAARGASFFANPRMPTTGAARPAIPTTRARPASTPGPAR